MKQAISKSFFDAFSGVKDCILKERNMKIHIFMVLVVIICGFLFKISFQEWMIVIILFALVTSLECVNTAIEATVDLVTDDYHDLAKLAKDTAAGAVLISAIASAIIGFMIFVPKLLEVL